MTSDVLERAIAPERSAKRSFRADVQGLRALAVVAVIAHHLVGWPRGGFVGVDVFFVISGFLITGLLLREHDRTGTISFTGFYRRRIKRILPASLLVLLVTVVAAHVVFVGARAVQVTGDGVWALFFAANWRFVSAGTDYFTNDGPVSPLQHFWSLAVEEQFYFVWPWLMLLVFVLVGRRRGGDVHRAHRIAGVVLLVVTTASFAWATVETVTAPASAYFSTFSRTWELGVGALLAVAAGRFARLPDRIRPLLAWTGLALIVAALAVVDEAAGFPAPWAALPVAGSALVILAGTAGPARFLWPLTNPVSRWLGDLSYSLYLWHFPVIVVLGAVMTDDPAFVPVALAVTLAASVCSYYLVEDPLRRSGWLERRPAARRADRTRGAWLTRPRRLAIGGTAAFAVAVVAVAFVVPGGDRDATLVAATSDAPDGSLVALERDLAVDLARAANADAWPVGLRPRPDRVGEEFFQSPVEAFGCSEAYWEGRPCRDIEVDDPDRTVVVVGDSVGAAWVPAVREALGEDGWTVVPLTLVGCPFLATTTVDPDRVLTEACPEHKATVVETIRRIRPALVIESNSAELTYADGSERPEQARRDGLRGMVERLRPYVGSYVTLAPPPPGNDPRSCVTRLTGPGGCEHGRSDVWVRAADADATVMAETGGAFVRTDPWFCVDGRCPVFARDTMILRDRIHITTDYATLLAPLLTEALWERRALVS